MQPYVSNQVSDKEKVSDTAAFAQCKRKLVCFKLNKKCVSSPLKLQDEHECKYSYFPEKKGRKLQHYSRKIFPLKTETAVFVP